MLNKMQKHSKAVGSSTDRAVTLDIAFAIKYKQIRNEIGHMTKKDSSLKRTYMRIYRSLNSPMIAKMVLGRSTMNRMSISRMYLKAFSLGIEPQQRPVGF